MVQAVFVGMASERGGMMGDICLIQVLDYEAQNHLNKKNKKVLVCKNCPIKDKCKKYTEFQKNSEKEEK